MTQETVWLGGAMLNPNICKHGVGSTTTISFTSGTVYAAPYRCPQCIAEDEARRAQEQKQYEAARYQQARDIYHVYVWKPSTEKEQRRLDKMQNRIISAIERGIVEGEGE